MIFAKFFPIFLFFFFFFLLKIEEEMQEETLSRPPVWLFLFGKMCSLDWISIDRRKTFPWHSRILGLVANLLDFFLFYFFKIVINNLYDSEVGSIGV